MADGMLIKDTTRMFSKRGGDTEIFHASDEDTAGDVMYFGYLNADGHWIILKSDRSADPVSHRYVSGLTDYSTNWTNRASLTYALYSALITT